MLRPQRRAAEFFAAVTLSALAAFGPSFQRAEADTVTAKPGLAPQFSRWPVPLYPSGVKRTMTWAPNSYGIDTSDSRPRVIAWYLGKLKSRAMQLDKKAPPPGIPLQLAVDGGHYIINLLTLRRGTTIEGTSINVIKN